MNTSVCKPSDLQTAVSLLSEAAKLDTPTAMASATADVYVQLLRQLAKVWVQLDQAKNPNSLRAARFAIRDYQNLIALTDRCLRGRYDALAVRQRIWLEQTGNKHQEPSEEVRELRAELYELHFEYSFFEMCYSKAREYGVEMPDWQRLREFRLKAQRKKAEKQEIKEKDERTMSAFLDLVAREVEGMPKSVEEQVNQERRQAAAHDQPGESFAESGTSDV